MEQGSSERAVASDVENLYVSHLMPERSLSNLILKYSKHSSDLYDRDACLTFIARCNLSI